MEALTCHRRNLILNTSTKTLFQSVLDVYEDAAAYFRSVSAATSNHRERTAADLAVREFKAGLEVLDLLVDRETDSFLTPEAASDVMQSVSNLLDGLDQRRYPLLAWQAASLIERTQTGGAVVLQEGETLSEWQPEDVTYH